MHANPATSARQYLALLVQIFFCAFLILASARCWSAETITLIAEDDWYPYSALKHGQPHGFAVDVIRAAYAAVEVNVEFDSAPYSRCLQLTKTGHALGCFDSLDDSTLAPDFLFHQVPILKGEIGIFARVDNPIRHVTVAMLQAHRVGITHGYTYGSEFEKDKKILRDEAPTDLSNLRKLAIGRTEYSLVYTRIVDYLGSAHPDELNGKFRQVGVIEENRLFVSFSKLRPEAPHFADMLDKGLLKIRANGTYARLEQKWKTPEP